MLSSWVRFLTHNDRRVASRGRQKSGYSFNTRAEYLGFCFLVFASKTRPAMVKEGYQGMTRIMKLFLAALVGFSALPFGSCKSEIDKAGKSVNENNR